MLSMSCTSKVPKKIIPPKVFQAGLFKVFLAFLVHFWTGRNVNREEAFRTLADEKLKVKNLRITHNFLYFRYT